MGGAGDGLPWMGVEVIGLGAATAALTAWVLGFRLQLARVGALQPRRAKAAIGKLTDDNADVQSGINIVLKALEAPIRQIAENAGVEGSIVVGRVLREVAEDDGCGSVMFEGM